MSDRGNTPEVEDGVVLPPTPSSPSTTPTKGKATKTKAAPKKAAKPKATSGVPGGRSNKSQQMVWTIAIAATNIDWDLVVSRCGYKDAKSARDTFRIQKKKFLESEGLASGEGEDITPPTKRKTAGSDDDNEEGEVEKPAKKPKAKAAPRKKAAAKKEAVQEDGDEAGEEEVEG